MSVNKKHKVVESFGDFEKATKVVQTPNRIPPAQFGANPKEGEQQELPFNFERSPEVGEEAVSGIEMTLEKIQAISTAGINKVNALSKNGSVANPYIERQLDKAYSNLREAYLRLMDAK
jgi:hypothetical protein